MDCVLVTCLHCRKRFFKKRSQLQINPNSFCSLPHCHKWRRNQQTRHFLNHIKKSSTPNGCWHWTGHIGTNGYGSFGGGTRGHRVYAHRFAYTFYYGQIPHNKWVLHTCDHPFCVNPNHLWLGNHRDNMRDMVQKKRHGYGSRNYGAKLTESQVKIIRAKYKFRVYTMVHLAKEFGIKRPTVSAIIHRKNWKHI